MTHRYRYCGLELVSTLPLPELEPSTADAPARVRIEVGQTPAELTDERQRTATFAHNGCEALWWLDGVGRFHVRAGGDRITLQPDPQAEEPDLRLMLLHPVWALASVMRGEMLLNAAAVADGGRVTAFIGSSACGKSTLTALLLDQGFTLVSDALLRFSVDTRGNWIAHPQAPWLQLWPSAVKHLEIPSGRVNPLRRQLPLQRIHQPVIADSLPIARIGLLRERDNDEPGILTASPRQGAVGFSTLLQHSAGNTWLERLADRRKLFHQGVGLLRQARIERLDLPWGWTQRERLVSEVQQWIEAGTDAMTTERQATGPDTGDAGG